MGEAVAGPSMRRTEIFPAYALTARGAHGSIGATMEWLTDPQVWISLLTLTGLEIVLGIDNVIFISILAGKLPKEQQAKARQLGLTLALVTRILLLCSITWLMSLTKVLFVLPVLNADISGKGLIGFFKTLQNVEFRYAIPQEDSYGRTHPLTGERIAVLQDVVSLDPAWTRPPDPILEARFQRVKAKLMGFVSDPPQTLRTYPIADNTVPARYARAYAWHRSAYPEKALEEVDSLLSSAPKDPYFLELKGQILLESGRPQDALPVLREANQISLSQPLIAALFGHALIATEDKANLPEATRVLKAAVSKDNENPFAWYQLGVVYEREGDVARARLATAERYSLEGRPNLALPNAEAAMVGIPKGSPDWIRAQDIAMAARGDLENQKRRR